jgi:nucleoside phosphorylase
VVSRQGLREGARPRLKPVLLTAATKWEAEPLARALGLAADAAARWSGTLSERRLVLLKTGMGAKRTADALVGMSPADFSMALSTGLCGAMQPGLRPGDLVADPGESELELTIPLRETAKALALPFHFGRILHTNIVLQPAAKRALGSEHRAVACDMETAAVRRWAHGSGLPVLAVRAVLDAVDDSLPADAPETEDPAALARFALTHAASLPGLLRTGWRSARAMKRLARLLDAYLRAI